MRRGPGNRVCQAGQLAPGERVQFHRVPGGHSEGETPGPIPNPEVKPLSADGTAREASRESRTPPEHTLTKRASPYRAGPLCYLCGLPARVRFGQLNQDLRAMPHQIEEPPGEDAGAVSLSGCQPPA